MNEDYNELVGIQARFSKVIPRYNISHLYRWRKNGKVAETGTTRGYDLHRHIPVAELCRNLREVYAPAILSVYRQITDAFYIEYLQLEVGVTPQQLGWSGEWEHWAEL